MHQRDMQLLCDVDTRWSSTLLMIERALELELVCSFTSSVFIDQWKYLRQSQCFLVWRTSKISVDWFRVERAMFTIFNVYFRFPMHFSNAYLQKRYQCSVTPSPRLKQWLVNGRWRKNQILRQLQSSRKVSTNLMSIATVQTWFEWCLPSISYN